MKLSEYIYSSRDTKTNIYSSVNDRTTAYKIYNSWHNLLANEVVFEKDIDNIKARKFTQSEKLKEIIINLDNNEIDVNEIYVLLSPYTLETFENDMPICLQNLEELSKFCNFLPISDVNEINIFIVYFAYKTAPIYLIDIIHTKYDYSVNFKGDYSINISISGLTYDRLKMLEIFFNRLKGNNKKLIDLVLNKHLSWSSSTEVTVSYDINDTCQVDSNLLIDEDIEKLFLEEYSNNKQKFTVNENSFNLLYLPSILMKKFRELEKIKKYKDIKGEM